MCFKDKNHQANTFERSTTLSQKVVAKNFEFCKDGGGTRASALGSALRQEDPCWSLSASIRELGAGTSSCKFVHNVARVLLSCCLICLESFKSRGLVNAKTGGENPGAVILCARHWSFDVVEDALA